MNIKKHTVDSDDFVVAVLGPTNTGKTYRAIERMLSCETGMIGFPLRLLARENYERIAKIKGRHRVALVTGEEKIIPRQATYYCCTVEAMPIEKNFEFLAVDEIQLAQDPSRGHVFTDRILRARGTKETMFMGSDTMKVLLKSLVPNIEFENCKRFSDLNYTGYKKLTRLPKRSAVVIFSMDDVYQTAETLRRQRGGTAVVLGALSPRTRNAQVEMYQSGEVDFLVATDAIGMGLNMDVHHVALAATRKFDGQRSRPLNAAEMAQIAGRAGRYMRDGTFGATGRVHDLEPDDVEAIENHNFPSVREMYWRNTALDYKSPELLLRSLDKGSGEKTLIRGRPSDDYQALKSFMQRSDILELARSTDRVHLLWDVCQIPDFRQTLSDVHQDLLAEIYRRLCLGKLNEDWVSAQISRLDDTKGDVDSLMNRIAHIRTWTYISFKSSWLDRAEYWQDKARAVEDNLSDALHEALINRFVDRRASVLMKSIEEGKQLLAGVRANGDVIVESHLIGHLDAFRFIPDKSAVGADYKAVMAAANKALKSEIKRRMTMILNAKSEQISLSENGEILWQEKFGSPLPGVPVAKLKKGDNILKPEVEIEESDLLAGVDREELQTFLKNWVEAHIQKVLEPLIKLENQEGLSGAVRGILFQLYESLGIVPRENLEELIPDLSQDDRAALRARRIKMGPVLVFLWELTKPAAVRLRALLWGLYHEKTLPMPVPKDGVVSMKIEPNDVDKAFFQAIGYPVYGPRAVRIDMMDRVISATYDSAKEGKFQAQHAMAEWLGTSIDDLYAVLSAIGHRKVYDPAEQADKLDADIAANPSAESNAVHANAQSKVEPSAEPLSDSIAKGLEENSTTDADQKAEIAADVEAKTTPLTEAKVLGSSEDDAASSLALAAKSEPAADIAAQSASENAEDASQPVQQSTPQQSKPELATFVLKRGKAFAKNKPQNRNFANKGKNAQGKSPAQDGQKKDRSKGKRERRKNQKGQDYKKSMMSAGPASAPEDSPFAILQQLKHADSDKTSNKKKATKAK